MLTILGHFTTTYLTLYHRIKYLKVKTKSCSFIYITSQKRPE